MEEKKEKKEVKAGAFGNFRVETHCAFCQRPLSDQPFVSTSGKKKIKAHVICARFAPEILLARIRDDGKIVDELKGTELHRLPGLAKDQLIPQVAPGSGVPVDASLRICFLSKAAKAAKAAKKVKSLLSAFSFSCLVF